MLNLYTVGTVEGGYQEVGGLRDVDMATNGEGELDGAYDE